MKNDVDRLKRGIAELGISLEEEEWEQKLQQFLLYYEMIIEKNKVMNLTAITAFDEVVTKHFLDSLSLCQVVDLTKPLRVLDLGTGAGFPGIPLKILFPHLEIVLMDSLKKRILFLQDVIEELGFSKITAVHGRAEEMARQPEYREQFDLTVSRAVANLSSLSEYCIPFVKKCGYFISYKSGDVEKEVRDAAFAIRVLGGEEEKVHSFQLPSSDISRSFVVIHKTEKTPKGYPRKAGTPSREPLRPRG